MARTTATNRTASTARVADGYRLNRQEHTPSASFDGSSTGITLGFKANSAGFTIASWIKVRKFTNGDRIIDQQDSGPSKGFSLTESISSSDRSVYFSVFGESSEEANIKMALNLWEWTHIAISFEPNSAKLYKNGVLINTDTSVSLGVSTTNIVIGKNASSAANYFNGLVRDFIVYDRVLNLSEVENVRDGVISSTNLKCHLPLYSDLLDISGNGNDGIGTVAFTYTNDSPFNDTVGLNMYAPLTSSLLLERGVGYPTWSRATKAWGFNELGYLTGLASGCAFFGGARLVYNYLRWTEDLTNAYWIKTGSPTVTANTFKFNAQADRFRSTPFSVLNAVGKYAFVFVISADAPLTVTMDIADASDGNPEFPLVVNITTTPTEYKIVGDFSAGTMNPSVVAIHFNRINQNASVIGRTVTLSNLRFVDVTGYDDSYVPEYVAVDVAAAPYFGAGIDGAKYYETDWQGAPIPTANLLGFRRESAATNNLLHCRDLSNAAWSTKTNITAAKTSTGLDGIANTATTLTATAADAIILQPITLASAARCASAYVKRRTGTGTISFTQDGGSTWTDITSQINGSTWSRVQITSTLANPSVGFKISTSGDAIDVDCVQNEAGAVATSPIVTTTATVTRNADSLTYQTAGNIDFAVGSHFEEWSTPCSSYTGFPVSCGSNGRLVYTTGGEIRTYDGTNVVAKAGISFVNNAAMKTAGAWSVPGGLKLSVNGTATVSGAFDGTLGDGAVISIGSGTASSEPVYVKRVAIYNYQMTDAELQALTT